MEKALCDKLYTLKPLKNYANLEQVLFDDLRIDNNIFIKLDIDKIEKLSNLYISNNIKLFTKYLRRKKIDYKDAKEDVIPFIKHVDSLDIWSKDFFVSITEKLK